MKALYLLVIITGWLCGYASGAWSSDGAILFMSSEGLHQMYANGTGLRTVTPITRKFHGISILPPNIGGLCVDSEKEIAFWTINDPYTFERKLFAIDARRDTTNPQPVELTSSTRNDYLGCAVDSAQSTVYFAEFDSGAYGIKISGIGYDGPDNIQVTKPTSSFPSPGIRVRAVEGGSLAIFGTVVYCTVFDDNSDTYVTQVDLSGPATTLTPLVTTPPDRDTFYSDLSIDTANRRLYILQSPFFNSPPTLKMYDLVGLKYSDVWRDSDISISVSSQQIGAYPSSYSVVGDNPDYIIYVKSGTPSSLSEIYAKNVNDLTEPETLIFSATGSMVGVEPGISPLVWMKLPPPPDPPIEPPVSTDIPDTLLPSGSTTIPDTGVPATVAPTVVPGGTGAPPPPPGPPPPPPRAIPTQPPPVTPQEFQCSDALGISECRSYADICDWDITSSSCVDISCVGLGEVSCGKLTSACLWKGAECIALPPCTTLLIYDDCKKVDGCSWVSEVCFATAALEDGSADDAAVSLFVIIVIGSVGLVIMCVAIALCCAIALRKKMQDKKESKSLEEGETSQVQLQNRERAHTVASPSIAKAERLLKQHKLIPPVMRKSDIFGEEGSSEDEADYIALRNCGLDSAAFASNNGADTDKEKYSVNAVLDKAEGKESQRERDLRSKVSTAREALVDIQRQGEIMIENESRAAALRNSFSEIGDARSEAAASVPPPRRATIMLDSPVVMPEETSVVESETVPLFEKSAFSNSQSLNSAAKKKLRHQSSAVSGSVATILKKNESLN